MALNPVDKLLGSYLGFVTLVMLLRHPFSGSTTAWMLVMHVLFGLLLFLFSRLDARMRVGNVVHELYPLVMVVPLYTEIGFLNAELGESAILANDAFVQSIEAWIFGGQISYTWLREYPSVFWSGALHLAYLSYYVIIVIGPVVLLAQKRTGAARMVLFSTMLAFVFCYMWFILFPVAGPNWVFDHPTGPVREVWSARLVYSLLDTGSSYGAAFPSSHVAATLAATLTLLKVRKPLGLAVLGPCLLLIVATVYCQMHYGVDAGSGVVVGIAAVVSSRLPTLNRVLKKGFPAARVGSRPMDDGAV
jgi:hypothetical protein